MAGIHEIRRSAMKKVITIISLIILLIAAGTIVFAKYRSRELLMIQINKDVQDYYFISCPNGNELDIKQVNSNEYQYSISCFPYSVTDSTKKDNYKLKVRLNQKFTFEKIGLLTGASGANSTTDFPNCLITENDSSRIQRFYLFSSGNSNDELATIQDEGKIYVSFKNAISSSNISSVIDEYSAYGTVTWLWVDTYNDSDSITPTIQNPQKDERGVFGIPLYYGGEKIAAPLDKFVYIINDKHPCLENEFDVIRNGIKAEKGEIIQSDVKIIGIVLLPKNDSVYSTVIDKISEKENVYVAN